LLQIKVVKGETYINICTIFYDPLSRIRIIQISFRVRKGILLKNNYVG